jgi:hypothetical protein
MARKPNPKNSPFVTASSIARELGLSNTNVEGIIKRAKLKPESSVPYAGGLMRLYLRDKLQPLVQAYLDVRAAQLKPEPVPEPAASEPAAPTPASPDRCLDELAKHLAVNDATLADQADVLRGLQQTCGLLLEQNKQLFKQLQSISNDTSALAAGLIGGGQA